ncbi:MAG: 30S ribosome-binding factor RbfA [Candidatus Omnitrophica bacterium]|nr:30S ribosome-binding factor RbfA [Candidatus Omnitrophota bacterium]
MNRMDKVNQLFKREISTLILMGEVRDPRLSFISITFVDISKDLSVAHIGFSVLDDNPESVKNAQAGLNSASGRIRHLIAERVAIRHIPELRFVYDNSIAYGIKMDRRLDEIRQSRDGESSTSIKSEDASPEDKE